MLARGTREAAVNVLAAVLAARGVAKVAYVAEPFFFAHLIRSSFPKPKSGFSLRIDFYALQQLRCHALLHVDAAAAVAFLSESLYLG